jgi:hypothetical protein
MDVDQLLAGDVTQPQEERQWPVLHVTWQIFGRFETGLLDDIGSIDPALQLPVETESDHLLQLASVAGQQAVEGGLIALRCPLQQRFQVIFI